MSPSYEAEPGIDAWQSLVHVSRRWRSLVLESPHRLNLQLCCTSKTPARDTLYIWPTFPLIVRCNMAFPSGTDNIIAALGQSNRVCEVDLHIAGGQFEEVLAQMGVSFPKLTVMQLWSHDKTLPIIPDSFLDDLNLPRSCDTSPWIPFHFQDCRSYFCLLLTSAKPELAMRHYGML